MKVLKIFEFESTCYIMGQTFYDFTWTQNVKGSTRCVEVLRSTFYKFLPSTHGVEVHQSQTFKNQNEENLEPIWHRSAIVAPNAPHFGQKMQKKLPFCRESLMDFDAMCRSTSINFLSDLTSTHRVKPLTQSVEVKT